MGIIETIVLALVQGLTEYLPISSTAHLIVVQRFFNIEPNQLFTIVLQFGTLLSSLFFFRKKILAISQDTVKNYKENNLKSDLGLWILIGIIPVFIIGFFASSILKQLYNNPYIIIFTTIFFGILFYIVELYSKRKPKKEFSELKLKNVVLIGLAQTLSIIPGVSRSGSTIVGGLLQRFSFKDSIEISFLMSIPVMFGATILELIRSLSSFSPEVLTQLGIGILIAFLAGLVSIKITLGFLEKFGFLPFLVYRLLFAVLILLTLT